MIHHELNRANINVATKWNVGLHCAALDAQHLSVCVCVCVSLVKVFVACIRQFSPIIAFKSNCICLTLICVMLKESVKCNNFPEPKSSSIEVAVINLLERVLWYESIVFCIVHGITATPRPFNMNSVYFFLLLAGQPPNALKKTGPFDWMKEWISLHFIYDCYIFRIRLWKKAPVQQSRAFQQIKSKVIIFLSIHTGP